MILEEHFTLANGVNIPKLGLGTWRIDDSVVAQVVQDAIQGGYRHIDTAQAYENEHGVGEGVRASGIARDEVFVTTKLAAECKSYAEAKERIDGSLKALAFDRIDLMLIHSPQPWSEFREGGLFSKAILKRGGRSRRPIKRASCAQLGCRTSSARIWTTSLTTAVSRPRLTRSSRMSATRRST